MVFVKYYSKEFITSLFFLAILFIVGCAPHLSSSKNRNIANTTFTFNDKNGNTTFIKSRSDWEKKRIQILDDMQKGMGALPDRSNLPDFDLQYTDSLTRDNYIRYTINFLVAENERLTAYLYVPVHLKKEIKYPAMLALHETDSLGKGSVDGQGKNKNLAYAKELAQRGYIVIAPDYPSFGDMKDYDFGKDRYQSGTMKGIFDHMRCVDLLQSMPIVNPDEIGVIGHSLGGHNSIFVGAFDTRLKVVVSSCGWTGFDYYDVGEIAIQKYGGRLGPWAIERYMPLLREKYDLDSKKIPFDFDEMISAIAPRIFFSNSPLQDKNFSVEGVKNTIEDVAKVYKFLNVPANLLVYYPEAKHDFPPEIRQKAYALLDSVFHHSSNSNDFN